MDVSVYRDCSGDVDLGSDSGFKYVVNEVNRTPNTCLYYAANKPEGAADMMISHLRDVLLSAVKNKLFLKPPPTPPVRQAPV